MAGKKTAGKKKAAAPKDATNALATIDMRLDGGVFVADFASMLADAKTYVKRFNGLTIASDDDLKAARGLRAEVNKKRTEFNRARLDLCHAYDKPKEAFVGECKKVLAVLDDAIDYIDVKIAERKEAMLEARKQLLADEYAGIAGDLASIIPLGAFIAREPKLAQIQWTPTKACNVLASMVAQAVSEREVIRSSELAFEADADRIYCEKLDLAAALAENKRLVAEQQAREAHIEANRALEVDLQSRADESSALASPHPAPAAPEPAADACFVAPRFTWSFRFVSTRKDAEAIAAFARSLGVESDGIKRESEAVS